jgi:hypothetical protein
LQHPTLAALSKSRLDEPRRHQSDAASASSLVENLISAPPRSLISVS